MKLITNCLLILSLSLMGCVSTSKYDKCVSSYNAAYDEVRVAQQERISIQERLKDYGFCIYKSNVVKGKCEVRIMGLGLSVSEREAWIKQCKVDAWEEFERCKDEYSLE